MKIFRFGLISFLSLFLIITIISLFIPSHVRISRATDIHGQPGRVLAEIADLEKWKNWYPGFDTLKIIPVTKSDSGLTEVLIASSQTTIRIIENKPGEIMARFNAESKKYINSGWKIITTGSGDGLTIQWYLDFRLSWYPWEKFLSLTYDKLYGQQMEQGLANLKKVVEQ